MKILDLIFAARPMLMLPVWSIYLVSTNILYPYSTTRIISWPIIIGLTLISAGAYYINQVYDYESDLLNQKLGFLQNGMISKRLMIICYLVVSVIGILTGYYVSGLVVIFFIILAVLGFVYSAKPIRLKDRPIGGILANSIAFGVLIPLTIEGNMPEPVHYELALYFGLTVGAVYLLTVIPDREGDKKTGKKTLAVYLSNRSLIGLSALLMAGSIYTAVLINNVELTTVSTLSILLALLAFIRPKETTILLACKFPIFLLSLLAAVYYPIYLIFLVALILLTRLYYKKRFGMKYPKIN